MTATDHRSRPLIRRTHGLFQRYGRVAALLKVLVSREIKIRYRRSALDIAWAIITPAVTLAVYGVVLTRSFDVKTACAPYLTSAWTGLVLWTFFATAVSVSVTSLLSSSELITKVYFPREAVPLSATGASLLDLVVGAVTVVLLMVIQGVGFGWSALVVVLPIALLVVWTAAVSVITAVVAVFARDLVHAVHLVVRVGFFATPVVYEAAQMPPAFAWTASVNPVAVAITGTREVLFCGELSSVGLMSVHLVTGCVLLVGGTIYTRSVESRLTDNI